MWEFVVLLELLGMNFMENNKKGHKLRVHKKMYCVRKEKCLLGRRADKHRLLHMSVTLEM